MNQDHWINRHKSSYGKVGIADDEDGQECLSSQGSVWWTVITFFWSDDMMTHSVTFK